jgi:hypothetical protein
MLGTMTAMPWKDGRYSAETTRLRKLVQAPARLIREAIIRIWFLSSAKGGLV